ncbi:hypothetical protein H072_2918 [Dactylellina haptotyla CBS 200.50]|uniref:DNA-directed DNA polymerase n=1 Tax=Dactylellina haptotyla (strain CBS 200.50) TaxID=1284197 RepID=S8C5U6_DACHA|nr:hypothetical protein H072_2918 [Dactylellina haptotyla CBS 200.50]
MYFTWSGLCLWVLGAAGTTFIANSTYNIYFHPLRHFPGPLRYRASRLAWAVDWWRGRLHRKVLALHLQYGPVVRIAPDELSFSDPAAWKEIYGHRSNKSAELIKDPRFYRVVEQQPPSILNADKDLHTSLRRGLAHGFSNKSLRDQEGIIRGYVDQLMRELGEKAKTSSSINMTNWYSWVTLDIIGDLALGQSLGCMDIGKRDSTWGGILFGSNFQNAVMVGVRYLRLGFLSIFVILWIISSLTKKAKMLHAALDKRIRGDERPDLIEGLMQKVKAGELDIGTLLTTSATLLVAGTETTATLLCGVTYLLLTNPTCLERLIKEVRSSFHSEEDITFASVQQLSYMLACLNEALRMYPPISSGLPRIVPKGGMTICGEFVPEKTTVSAGHYVIYHHPKHWTSPSEFHPERFLGDSKFLNDKLDALQPFSLGPRDCIGRNLAYAEMKVIFARILFSFDMSLAPESSRWLYHQKSYMLWDKPDLNFEIEGHSYQTQYVDIYFLRLTQLKPIVEAAGRERWDDMEINGETVRRVDRVLDVRQGELCWVSGTVYMDMPLKPNVLEDISRDHFISAPPPRQKYRDFNKDEIMLEDESGRLRLVGGTIMQQGLVTGCIISVMGTETASGEFEVVDLILPELAPQPERSLSKAVPDKKRYVALASGLNITGNIHESIETHLLVEYLLGESGSPEDQSKSSSISRLILAGNSLADPQSQAVEEAAAAAGPSRTKAKKYGYDAAAYNAKPTTTLDTILSDLCTSISVTLMPGETDPANVSLPQQKMHPTMFPSTKYFTGSSFIPATNPYSCEIDDVKFLGTSGQTVDDIFKYVDGEDRLDMMEKTLRWRHVAPTAPDTLWCYPFQDADQFIISTCPHVYFVGNQPEFGTRLVYGSNDQIVRLIMVPKFSETGELVLVDLDTLECELVNFKAKAALPT